MEHQSDIDLFQRIRRNDRFALNSLFANYYQQLCRFAATLSVTPEQAEEIVSDVFFLIWKNRDRLDIHSNMRGYLYRCVQHAALAAMRKASPEVPLMPHHDNSDSATPETELEYQQLENQLGAVIDNLPGRSRQIFVMSRFDGMKYKEIAYALGVSEKTVEHHIVKALDIIRANVSSEDVRRDVHNSITVS